MPKSDLSQSSYDLLRKHFEFGLPIDNMRFTPLQKKRIRICEEVYKLFANDPFMNLRQHLRNKYNRTDSEIYLDLKCINFIASLYEEGNRNIEKIKVRYASDLLLRDGANMGDLKSVKEGMNAKIKINQFDQTDTPKEDRNEIDRMPIVITTDVSKKFKGKKNYDDDEMRRIRAKYNVKMDPWQDMVEGDNGEYVETDDASEEEEEKETEL